ncbi:translation initiation factor eIF4e [Ephemerocybe angulata]|uniref:Translation initiation factor eIF4e n=1 Tax=Ephemerocybe angulata TaxID=980116 RepID=A0A8H6MAU1_9AGAR|nr:translation initiation factor eIF4e [Tulosesus angulatus]
MASNYFSNHSVSSRFPASPATTSNPSQPAPTPSQPTTPAATQRSRLPSSKHFSTSLSNGERSKSKDSSETSSAVSTPKVHPLRNTYVRTPSNTHGLASLQLFSTDGSFGSASNDRPGTKSLIMRRGFKKISAFGSVESFWSLWTHLAPPSALQPTTDYLLFHSSIRRPVWEDPLNINGGKWIIRLRKGVADRLWEDLVLAVVGDLFDDCRTATGNGNGEAEGDSTSSEAGGDDMPEICGCTISVRQSEDIISLWNRVEADKQCRDKIRDTLRRVLNLPPSTIMEYKTNTDSMTDKSSFRNSAIDRTPLS